MNLNTWIGDGVNKSRNGSVRKTAEGRGDIGEREEIKQPRGQQYQKLPYCTAAKTADPRRSQEIKEALKA
jgi:hypothetical protein